MNIAELDEVNYDLEVDGESVRRQLSRKIWEDLLAKYPQVHQFHGTIGTMYAAENNPAKAIEHLKLARCQALECSCSVVELARHLALRLAPGRPCDYAPTERFPGRDLLVRLGCEGFIAQPRVSRLGSGAALRPRAIAEHQVVDGGQIGDEPICGAPGDDVRAR